MVGSPSEWIFASPPRTRPSGREARDWLAEQLEGEFAVVRGRGGPGDEHALFEERLAWERALGAAGLDRHRRGRRSTAAAACRSRSR